MENTNGKAITAVLRGQPYFFGTAQDREQAVELEKQHGGDKDAFHVAMNAAGLFWGDTERLYEDDWSLEALTARHRALARYRIYRHGLAANRYHRVREDLDYSGLRYDEARTICDRLNAEARAASPEASHRDGTSSWGLTMHFMELERPVPQMWRCEAIAA